LQQRGIHISPGGVRCVWLRHDLESFKKRLKRIEEIAAQDGVVLTEAQVQALEKARCTRESDPEEIETHHPGYLISQDTMYVGYIKGVGRIYQQTVVDTHSSVAFAKLYDTKTPLTAADCLNDAVLPFFEEQNIDVLRVLTDRGTEYCGREDTHPYQLFLGLNDIDHTRTKVKHPQTNGICERFHQTVQNEFYRVTFRKRIYAGLDELQADLDEWLLYYNERRTHQGKRCQGRTPMQTFMEGKKLAQERRITPTAEPPRMGSEACNSSEAAVLTA
jgi:transposase InsO family protein